MFHRSKPSPERPRPVANATGGAVLAAGLVAGVLAAGVTALSPHAPVAIGLVGGVAASQLIGGAGTTPSARQHRSGDQRSAETASVVLAPTRVRLRASTGTGGE